jgi:hypothetical protein
MKEAQELVIEEFRVLDVAHMGSVWNDVQLGAVDAITHCL